MAKNPTELAKLLNEMQNALQELSDKQLDSVSRILVEQKEAIKKEKKVSTAKKKLSKEEDKLKKKKTKDNNSIIGEVIDIKNGIVNDLESTIYTISSKSKSLKNKVTSLKDKLGTSLIDGLGIRGAIDSYKSIKGALSDPKKYLKDKIFGKDTHKLSNSLTIKRDLVLSHSSIQNLNVSLKGNLSLNSQTLSLGKKVDFDKKVNNNDLDIKVLKDIDSNIGNLNQTQDSSFFSDLSNTIKSFGQNIALGATGLGSAVAGGGVIGKLKSSKLGGIAKSVGSKVTKFKPSKTGLAIGAASLIGGGLLAKNMISDDSNVEELTPRMDGGNVEKGKPYIVGESGKELFVPKQDGHILSNKQTFASLSKDQFDRLKLSQKNRHATLIDNLKVGIDGYVKPLNNTLSNYFKAYTEDYTNYKTDLKTSFYNIFDTLKDFLGNTGAKVKEVIKSSLEGEKSLLNIGDKKEESKDNQPSSPISIPKQITNPENNNTQTISAPQAITASTSSDYSVGKIDKPLEVTDEMKSKWMVDAFHKSLKIKDPYTPSTTTNMFSNPFGTSYD